MADDINEEHPLDTVISSFEDAFDHPELYLKPPTSLHKNTLIAIKRIFDFCKRDELRGKRSVASTCPLQELLIENFDDEQIWQEIELQNTPLMRGLKQEILDLKENPNKLSLLLGGRHIVNHRQDLEEKKANFGNDNGEVKHAENSDDQCDKDDENGDEDDNDDDISCNDDDDDYNDNGGDHEEEDANINDGDSREVSFSNGANRESRPSKKKSQVDDTFFKLSDMLEFLDKEDRKYERAYKKDNKINDEDVSGKEDIEPIDYFIDMDSDDTDDDEDEGWSEAIDATESLVRRKKEKNRKVTRRKTSAIKMKYADFFDPPEGEDGDGTNEQNEDVDEDEEEEEEEMEVDAEADTDQDTEDDEIPSIGHKEEDTKILSNFEKKQERLKQKIEKLEKANLAEKPWQMSGETGGTVRPINSLLEEDVSFDHATTSAPDITEETTQNLEDIVKQRIKDEAWDDVERKVKPVTEPYEYKKKLPLDQEKSKLSLSQIYEQEYLKQTQVEAEEKEIEEHAEIKALMTKLFVKLDALSNFHFTPKPPKPELKVVSNVPVISVEEVTPATVSDAMMLAPEEVHEKKRDQKGSSEKTDTDRKRDRRAKKRRQHDQAAARGKKAKLKEKLKPGLGNKYSKKAALKKLEKDQTSQKNVSVLRDEVSDKPVKTSSTFFSRLQDEVRDQVKAKKDTKKKKEKSAAKVSQLKL